MLITSKAQLECFYSQHRVWQGIPGIARTKKGRTFLTFYSGQTSETYGNYAMLFQSATDFDFGEPIAVVKKEGKFRCFDPVLWIDPLDRLWFIWSVMPGEEVYASICEDPDAEVLVWGEEFYIGRGIMMNKPTVLTSGEWLFPIAVWKTDIASGLRKSGLQPEEKTGSYIYKTSDNGKHFTCLGMSDVLFRSCDEHMVLELRNGVLMMLIRTTYGIGASYSYDRGKTWSAGEDSKLGGPSSRFFIRRLRSGRILLINHVNFTGRNNLTALLSEDDGKTFPYALTIDERSNVSYPDAFEADDGYIYIVYDRDRGCAKTSLEEAYGCAREILTAKITETDIIHGSLVSENSFLKNVVSKLAALAPEDPDPYKGSPTDLEEFADSLLQGDGDIIEKVFLRYPVSCTDLATFDSTKLDALIEQFYQTGSTDKKLLVKIIQLVSFPPASAAYPHPIVQRIQAYMQEHFTEDFSIKHVAADLHISVYYLSHLFKAVTGISAIDYRNELRLTKAKQLLIRTNSSICDIALACGFNNASYFAEVFSQSERISPSEFRRYHQVP